MEFHNLPNTQKRVSSWVIWALVAILAGIPFAELPVAATGKRFKPLRIHSFSHRITWTPPTVTTIIAPGESQTLSVSLTAARTLRNVRVRVARELQPFVHVGPAAFERIGKGQTVNINLTIFAPLSMAAERVEGKLRLFRQLGFGRKRKTIMIPLLLARPLPVVIDIEPTAPVITITNPEDSATVAAESLLVSGTVEAGGEEVGVTVNDFPAAVQGNTFAALVPVTPETTTLTAVATTVSGDIASNTIAITATPAPDPAVVFHASPRSGVAPLTVTLSLRGAPTPTSIELDFEGDGVSDVTASNLATQQFIYVQPSLYFPTVTVTDAQGSTVTASAIVQVYDQAEFDALLQGKWAGMRDALHNEDIEGALRFIDVDARDEFRADFTALAPFLPQIGQEIQDIRFIELRGNRAEYELLSTENGETFSYLVIFRVDEDGIWRLAFF